MTRSGARLSIRESELPRMPDVLYVTIQTRAPRRDDPGAVIEGWYIVSDGTVKLTDRAGNPIKDFEGKLYSQQLGADGSARVAATRLLKAHRLARKSARVSGFDGPINYPRSV